MQASFVVLAIQNTYICVTDIPPVKLRVHHVLQFLSSSPLMRLSLFHHCVTVVAVAARDGAAGPASLIGASVSSVSVLVTVADRSETAWYRCTNAAVLAGGRRVAVQKVSLGCPDADCLGWGAGGSCFTISLGREMALFRSQRRTSFSSLHFCAKGSVSSL